jgi:hypothetical protein
VFEFRVVELTRAQVKQLNRLHSDFLNKAAANPGKGPKLPVEVSLVAFPISSQTPTDRIGRA